MEGSDRRVPPTADPLDSGDAHGSRAFTISLIVVVVVVVVALGYSFVRDPGPRPPIQPTISGTDDGSLKRAVVHYLGAVATGDPAEVEDVSVSDTAKARWLAEVTAADFHDAARQHAEVSLEQSEDFGWLWSATITYADGRTQSVDFQKEGRKWLAAPTSTRPPPASVTDEGPAATTPTAAA